MSMEFAVQEASREAFPENSEGTLEMKVIRRSSQTPSDIPGGQLTDQESMIPNALP